MKNIQQKKMIDWTLKEHLQVFILGFIIVFLILFSAVSLVLPLILAIENKNFWWFLGYTPFGLILIYLLGIIVLDWVYRKSTPDFKE